MSLLAVGDTIPVSLQLEDGATDKFPRAFIYKPDGTLFGTLDLAHVANGGYEDDSQVFPGLAFLRAVYVVYTDAGHSIESAAHMRAEEKWERNDVPGLLHQNSFLDNTVHSANGTTHGRLRQFVDKTAADAATDGAADGAQGEVRRWDIDTTYDGYEQIATHKITRTL